MMKALYVEWIDACSKDDWHFIGDVKNECHPCKTIGFVCKEDSKALTLAVTHGRDGKSVAGTFTIPKSTILKRRIVRLR